MIRDHEILDVFANSEHPFLSTSEIADEIARSRKGVGNRLKQLEQQDELKSRLAGGSRIWWLKVIDEQVQDLSIQVNRHEIGVEVIDTLDIRGDDNHLKPRRLAVNEIFKQIFQEGKKESPELKSEAASQAPGTGYNQESIWDACIRPSLKETILFDHSRSSQSGSSIHDAVDWWYLTPIAEQLVDQFGKKALWENWPTRKDQWENAIYVNLWYSIEGYLEEQEGIGKMSTDGRGTSHIPLSNGKKRLYFEFEFTDYIWFGYSGVLTFGVEFLTDGRLSEGQKDKITSSIDFPVTCQKLPYDHRQVQLSYYSGGIPSAPVLHRITTEMPIDPRVEAVQLDDRTNAINYEELEQIDTKIQTIRDKLSSVDDNIEC